MSVRFMDSFDHYATAQLLDKWTSGAGSIAAGAVRTGIQGLSLGGYNNDSLTKVIDAQGTWIIGGAIRLPAIVSNVSLASTLDSGNLQGCVLLNGTGTLSLLRGGTVVATSVNTILANVFYFIELKHIIDNVVGLLEVRVNGAVWATFSGDTQETANSIANGIRLGPIFQDYDTVQFDDLYVLDGVDQSIADPNSPPNNDYLGDHEVRFLAPIGAGNYTEFATLVGAPTHWQAEDEVPPTEDTDYVEDTIDDRRDTYAMADLPAGSYDIPGIQLIHRVKQIVGAPRKFARLIRRVSDNQGADTALSTSYLYYLEILGGDPIAAGAWTKTNIDAMEVGQRVRS